MVRLRLLKVHTVPLLPKAGEGKCGEVQMRFNREKSPAKNAKAAKAKAKTVEGNAAKVNAVLNNLNKKPHFIDKCGFYRQS